MSSQSIRVVRRAAISNLLKGLLSSAVHWFKSWLDSRRYLSKSNAGSRRTTAMFELLEPRMLLSADLVGGFTASSIPDSALPGDSFNIPVVVRNIGADVATVTPVVRLYASNTGQIDAQSVALGESAVKSSPIKAGNAVTVNVPVDVSRIASPGDFRLFALVDATDKVRETNEGNNVASSSKPLSVLWSFGNVPGQQNAGSITLTDADGTRVTFTLSGAGRGDVVRDGAGFDVHLYGTNANTALQIKTAGGSGHTTIDDVRVDGSLKEIQADKVDLSGSLTISGTVRTIVLRDLAAGSEISIAGANVPVKFIASRVNGANIVSASSFDSVAVNEWVASDSGPGRIQAPSIGKLTVQHDFSADLWLTGTPSGTALSSVLINGDLLANWWNVGGSAGSISARSINAAWLGNFAGFVQSVSTTGDMSGTLAAPAIGSIQIGGNLDGARILVGTVFGSGAAPSLISVADQFTKGELALLRVEHSIRNSEILVGVDPVDGIYDNGNDVIVGGVASRIQQIIVGGGLTGNTSFTAGAFPNSVKINGQNLRSTSVPQFHTSTGDSVAPQVSLALRLDTGTSDSDGVTYDSTVSGQVIEAGRIAGLYAAMDTDSQLSLVDIKRYLQADNSFVLDTAALAAVLGRPLDDGRHTLLVKVVDGAGNAAVQNIAFILDRAVGFESFGLAAESDSGVPGDQLTQNPYVNLRGVAEGYLALELEGYGNSISDGAGRITFGHVALAEGDNNFTLHMTDLAGNQAIYRQTVRLDSVAPTLQAALANDSGASQSDGLTNESSIAGSFNDHGSEVQSLSVALDRGSPFDLLAVPSHSLNFFLDPGFLNQLGGGALSDGAHTLQFAAYDAAGNTTLTQVNFILDQRPPTIPQFDLAPESDTGTPGDQHTTQTIVSLTGESDADAAIILSGIDAMSTRNGDSFRFDGVALAAGENVFQVLAVDRAGNQAQFTGSIFRDELIPETGLPDLVVLSVDTQILSPEVYGQSMIRVNWVTANVGTATARGEFGSWVESVYFSYDDIPFNGNDFGLGFTFVNNELAPGAQQQHTVDVPMYDFIDWGTPGLRAYVSVDDDIGYPFFNSVFEKAAGEYNNLTFQDVTSGVAPPPIPAWDATQALPLSQQSIGGSIDAPGEVDVFAFELSAQTKLYFDSLSANEDLEWELRSADGTFTFGRDFAHSDAFGMGDTNALLNLGPGEYELHVSGVSAQSTGAYAFRLMDVDAVASHELVFDGGPLLSQVLARGDQTDVYQFQGTEGQRYIAGGPGDVTTEGALFWRLFDPEGHQVWTSQSSPSDILTFGQTGSYTLLVEGRVERTDPTRYHVYVFEPKDRQYEETLGQIVNGFLDAPGQVNTYTFSLTEATALYMDGRLDSHGAHFRWTLEELGGGQWSGNTSEDSGSHGIGPAIMKVEAGSYVLRIQGEGDASGWYNFQLIDVLNQPAPLLMPDEPSAGFLAPGFISSLHRFEGQADQQISILLDTSDPEGMTDPAYWLLVDPHGNVTLRGSADVETLTELNATGTWTLVVQGRQFGWNAVDYSLTVGAPREQPHTPVFDLDPESDTGLQGDHRTTAEMVSLVGVTSTHTLLSLTGTSLATYADGNGAFRFDNVALMLGENTFTVQATDFEGRTTEYTRTIFREAPVTDSLFPDLVVSGIHTQVVGTDGSGGDLLEVSWTTSNSGPGVAQGRHGAWAEAVYLSYDDTPWNGDSWLGNIKVSEPLAPGESQTHTVTVSVPSWFAPGYRVYVVTDDEQYIYNEVTNNYDFFANEVAEKTAGEYNNLVIQDIDLGIAPAALSPSGPDLALDGSAVGGSLEAGETDAYRLHLDASARLYFDSLSANSDLNWNLHDTITGVTLYEGNFATSDAFGMGQNNPLFSLAAGDYELTIANAQNQAGDYGFRLLNPDLAASHDLVLDAGPLLRQVLERGDWTDLYQFDVTAGTHYVAGGPNDWAIDGALYWRMFDPAGNQVWTSTTSPSDESSFNMTGTYTLMVEGRVGRTDPAQYNVYLFTPQNRDIDLTLGHAVQGFIDSPGQVNTYHFTLEQSTVAFFDGWLESNGPYFQWTLEDASGFVAGGNTREDTNDIFGYAQPIALAAGTYSLRIHGEDNAGGWYNFELFDLLRGPAQPLSYETPAVGELSRGFNSALYRFDGSAGETLKIWLNPSDEGQIFYDPQQWLLVDSSGNVVSKGQSGTPLETTLADTGSYSLLIQGHRYNWWGGQYSLTISQVTQPDPLLS